MFVGPVERTDWVTGALSGSTRRVGAVFPAGELVVHQLQRGGARAAEAAAGVKLALAALDLGFLVAREPDVERDPSGVAGRLAVSEPGFAFVGESVNQFGRDWEAALQAADLTGCAERGQRVEPGNVFVGQWGGLGVCLRWSCQHLTRLMSV